MSKQQIGVIGLAVMGKNLALNIESRGFSVAVYNRSAYENGSNSSRKIRAKIC